MNYEVMWNELKAKIEDDLRYHQSGIMQSIGESVHGAIKCKEFLNYIKKIEERYA
jgi:hypothetical protein